MRNLPSLWRSERNEPFRMLQREVDRFFNQYLEPINWESAESRPAAWAFTPACDAEETDTHYLLSMDLPGLSKSDVKIEFNQNQLRVAGERKEERQEGKKPPYRSERYYGSFERVMTLPTDVKVDQAEAHFENGVLRIALPKAEAAKSKQIPIGEGKSSFFSKFVGKKEAPQPEKLASTASAQQRVAG